MYVVQFANGEFEHQREGHTPDLSAAKIYRRRGDAQKSVDLWISLENDGKIQYTKPDTNEPDGPAFYVMGDENGAFYFGARVVEVELRIKEEL